MNKLDKKLLDNLNVGQLLDLIDVYRKKNKVITFHPNGFLQLPLSNSDDKRTVRFQLHIWPEDISRRGKEIFQVHDHAFGIKSFVLVGSLINTFYEIKSNPNGKFRLFQGDRTGNQTATNQIISCEVIKSETISAGHGYTIPKDAFHSSVKDSLFLATVIEKTDPDVNYRSKVIAPLDYVEDKIEVDRSIDQTIAWNNVKKVEGKIRKMYL